MGKQWNSISVKLMIILTVIIIFSVSVIGTTSYYIAKNQLIKAGEQDLSHIVNSSLAVLEAINTRVEQGELSLEEGKEEARILLSGPKLESGGYDFTKSRFLYKEQGYLIGYDANYSAQVHPSNEIGSIPEDTSNREKMVKGSLAANVEEHYVHFDNLDEVTQETRKKIAYMQPFEPWDWYIGLTVFEDEFYGGLSVVKTIILIATFAIILVSVLIFYMLIRRKIGLLREVTAASLSIADGHIQVTNLPESSDEIGQLARAYNAMSLQLRQILEGVREKAELLAASSEELSASSEQITKATEEVANAIQSVAAGSDQQSGMAGQANVVVKKMSEELHHVEVNSQNVAQASAEALNIVEQGGQSLQSSIEQMQHINQSVGDLGIIVNLLGKRSEEINDIVDVISDIAAQTNLLALNAAIEAARAGEHGRGFAVVADQVRKLAEQSTSSTEIIRQLITSIQEDTRQAVESMNSGTKETEHGIVIINEAFEGFKQIQQFVHTISSQTQEVSASIGQMTQGVEQVVDVVSGIDEIAGTTTNQSQDVSAATEEQLASMEEIASSATALSHIAEELQETVNRFKL